MGEFTNAMDSALAVQERVREALAADEPLDIYAGSTKGELGRQVRGTPFDVSRVEGVVSYEPGELILVARPGTALREVEGMLASENQYFAFEPPAWGEGATIGGTVACNLSGSRRFKMGALRDHILGIEMVDGSGELIRAGGKVVKNVTGYDLSKALAGSFGILGALTEVCLKVWPRPETEQTLKVYGLKPPEALVRILDWAARPLEITGLAYDSRASALLARVEGPAPAVLQQIEALPLDGLEAEVLEGKASQDFWRQWRELEWLVPKAGEQRWRFSGPPTRMVRLMEALKAEGLSQWGLDWAGGLLWAVLPVATGVGLVHRTAVRHQALAWRFAAQAGGRNEEAFTPPNAGVFRMNQMLKKAMDPKGIFNPGKMYALDEVRA
ncbi:MAG: glycolate oxidase subunit GlcE [Candidatus Latescibacterota bacterium]|jgi:glycolate oxidase FAD binding subunit